MTRIGYGMAVLAVTGGLLAAAPSAASAQEKAPPGGQYKQVCKLVELPCFLPGLGDLYVVPSTIPAGPWLGYDHDGNLVNTVYMIPIKDMDDHKSFDDLEVAKGKKVDHVSVLFTPAHPGVAVPHYHIILWYIPPEKVKALK
ncbi:MAG TPA: DUF5602 domain-containing protein [Gemmatimonadaceae bacterium]|nr:DUF5602 domain-containing protein [Gemmatimonadaceae bacterium]